MLRTSMPTAAAALLVLSTGMPMSLAGNGNWEDGLSARYLPQSPNLENSQAEMLFQGVLGDRSANTAPLRKGKVYRTQPGPWGTLEYFMVTLPLPDSLVQSIEVPSEVTEWFFPRNTLREAAKLLLLCGASGDELKWIPNPEHHRETRKGVELFPPPEFLENLDPVVRSAIARQLRQWPENRAYLHPYVVEADSVESWMEGAGCSPETVRLTARCTYQLGPALVFSDVPLVLSRIREADEEQAFIQALNRKSGLQVRVCWDRKSDLQQVHDYWSLQGARSSIGGLLACSLDTRGVSGLDLVTLLPPIPRRLVNLYPEAAMGAGGHLPDCHWTTANFFRAEPNNRFLDTFTVMREITREYTAAEPPLKFGDAIVIFEAESREALHSATYLADDLVYTKNGRNITSPWLVMRLQDMAARYSLDGDIRIEAYRRKPGEEL